MRNWDPGCMVDNIPTLKCLDVVFGNLLYISGAFVALILFIMLIWGAFQYLTAFGNAEKMKKGRGVITYALIGVMLYISAYLILKTIDVVFLGGQNKVFKFEIPDEQ